MNALIELVRREGYRPVAEKMGCRYQRIQQWISSGRIPAERAVEVEEKLGIPRHLLRPDLWPDETRAP